MILLLLTALAAASFEDDLDLLAGEVDVDGAPIESRCIHHPDHDRARDWLVASLEGIEGLDVWEEPFSAAGEDDLANIAAELPGTDTSLPPLLLTAHYDSIASSSPGWISDEDPAPGADDNASGVVAVLAIARELAAHEPGFGRTVRFVLFDGEEYGLHGSERYVADLTDEPDLVINCDPLGNGTGGSPGILWIVYDARWPGPAEELVLTAEDVGAWLQPTPVDEELLGGDSYSDHYPFWVEGIPALHLVAVSDPDLNHTMDDRAEYVDMDFLAEAILAVGSYAFDYADPHEASDEPEDEGDEVVAGGCGCSAGGGGPWLLPVVLLGLGRRR